MSARKETSTNLENQRAFVGQCPVNDPLYRIGMRWKMQVLHTIGQGRGSFGELKRALPGVSDHVLGRRLRELAAERLVDRAPVGRGVSYATTARGAALLAIMDSLCAWETTPVSGAAPSVPEI